MRQADTEATSEDGKESHAGTAEWVGELLGEWQTAELRIARGFAECRGLATEQLEDIYQETALALLNRPYGSEEHLRNALRHGIKHRALNVHRDTRRRAQILQQSAPSMQRIAESHESAGPEEAALADHDRLIVREFLAELDELEQRVFWLIAEGMRYRAIAPILGLSVNEARNASRSCERKRERFQLLYDTGRLCGYRAASIQSLQRGELTSEEIAARAFAHLDACASCRAQHKTNARRLGRSFHSQIAALLPLPAMLGRLSWLGRPWLRAGAHLRSGVRDRTAALIGVGGASAKVTAGVVTVAVVTGGTIGATRAFEHSTTRAHHQRAGQSLPVPSEGPAQGSIWPRDDVHAQHPRSRPKAPRPRRSARARTTSHGRGTTLEVAEREFAPEEQPGPPEGRHGASTQPVPAIHVDAEHEFGIG
jgi:RNA polymerase sigma factor (sigma-70 family)